MVLVLLLVLVQNIFTCTVMVLVLLLVLLPNIIVKLLYPEDRGSGYVFGTLRGPTKAGGEEGGGNTKQSRHKGK